MSVHILKMVISFKIDSIVWKSSRITIKVSS